MAEHNEQQDFGLWLVIIIALLIFFGLIFQGGLLGNFSSSDFDDADFVVEPVRPGGVFGLGASGGFLGGFFGFWRIIAIIFIILDILLILGITYLLRKGRKFGRKPSLRAEASTGDGKASRKKDGEIEMLWRKVAELAKGGSKESVRLAIMEGDALLDFFLRKYGFKGETVADRLKKVPRDEAPNLEAVWAAHKLRNELVHTPGKQVSDRQAQIALTSFRDFLINMGVL